MCGRYANHVRAMHDWSALLGDWPTDVVLGFNIAPTRMIPAFTATGGVAMRWGLIPGWADPASMSYATFNARLESVREKPAFRSAWRHHRRCLVPALGYYEWRQEAGSKQPYFVHLPPSEPLLLAGLYEPAREQVPASCTILTRAADPHMVRLHDRVPVILPAARIGQWLSADDEGDDRWLDELAPAPLQFYPVSRRVNQAREDDADLILPIARTAAMLD